MKNLYRRISKANQPLEQTEENPSDKKLLNELCGTNLRIRALKIKKQSSAEAGRKSKASTIQSIFLSSKSGIIVGKLRQGLRSIIMIIRPTNFQFLEEKVLQNPKV